MGHFFTVEIHHGGLFVENPTRYVRGVVNHVNDLDSDKWSKLEMEEIVVNLGYTQWKNIWYRVPGMEMGGGGLRVMFRDSDAMDMASYAKNTGNIEVYVEHTIEEPLVVQDEVLPLLSGDGLDIHEVLVLDECQNDNGDGVYYNISDSDDSVVDVDVPIEEDDDLDDDDLFDRYTDFGVGGEPEDGDDSDNSDYLWGSDEEQENTQVPDEKGIKCDYESEELLSGVGSSESENENEGERVPPHTMYRLVKTAENIKFEEGMVFTSLAQFKEAVTEYAVAGGYGIKFAKNDKERVRAICDKETECPFTLLVSKVPRQITFQIKTCVMEHNCTRSYKNVRLNSKFLFNKLINKVKDQPNIKLSRIQERVQKKYVVHISRSKAYRAKRRALDKVEGSHAEQYASLWDYCHELRRSNIGSTIKMNVNGYNEGDASAEIAGHSIKPIFKRLYICFEACKKGFVEACRPVIGIDGCHLKGPYGGILLAAVGRDPNEEYFPIAVAAVEAENKDAWEWFLRLLLSDLDTQRHLTFTSDQQKVRLHFR